MLEDGAATKMNRQIVEHAIAAYQAGDFLRAADSLEIVLNSVVDPDPALLALFGNASYKAGKRTVAAETFLALAKRGGPETARFAELAATLFLATGQVQAIFQHADFLLTAAPQSTGVAFACAKVLTDARDFVRLGAALDRLDRNDDAHIGLMVQGYRSLDQTGRLVDELKAIIESDPERDAVRMFLYFLAQDICDFELQAERDAYLASLDEPALKSLLAREPFHGRLFRSEDERVNTLPGLQYSTLNALKRDRSERRAFSTHEKRISIGYLSNDFYSHATMVLLGEALNYHDDERFDITLLCYTAEGAALEQQRWPEKLRNYIVPVRDLSDEAVANLIDERGIDILVDLKGHTLSARASIVNLSRAPIKVSYLGFPGSIPEMDYDYIIGDQVVTPDFFKDIYPEKLCRLPGSYQCNNSSWRQKPNPVSRADFGLPEDAFVFASFNQTIKITARTMDLWAQVLRNKPDSLFWVMVTGKLRQDNLLAALTARGVAPERVIFASQLRFPDHISRIALADLALDTFPCNGHTTTSDMLWAGLPVVTILGTAFASRVSASLLHAVELGELVADTDEAFVSLASGLANEPERLHAMREHLTRNRESLPLFDTRRFTGNLEKAYEMMAARGRAGLLPDHLDVKE